MQRSRTDMVASSPSSPTPPLAAENRINLCHAASGHYKSGRYHEAAELYESALNDASCNDPAVVVVESTAAAMRQRGRNGKGGIGGGGSELLDADLVVDMINRAATAHSLGRTLDRLGLPEPAAGNDGQEEGGRSANARSTSEDPLPCYKRAAELYKLCHAAALSGRVRNVTMVEREALDVGGADNGDRRIICVESSAVQCILAAAAAMAERSDVDGTIACHEEIVSFLLGVDEDDNSHADSERGNGSGSGDGDGGGASIEREGAPADEHEDEMPGRLTPSSTSSTGTSGGDNAPDDTGGGGGGGDRDGTSPIFVKMFEHQRMRLISNSLNMLGSLYARRGDDEDAIASYTDALDLLRSVEDPVGEGDGPTFGGGDETIEGARLEVDIRDDIARTLLSLSALHGQRHDIDDAIDYGEEALEVLSDRHGDTHDLVGKDSGNEKAESGHVQGSDKGSVRHPAVLSALHALGRTYDLAGDFDAAMSCYEDAFLGRCRSVGSDDLSVADVLVDMASALQRTGNVEGALELNSQALRIYRLLISKEAVPKEEGKFVGPNKCSAYLAGALQNRGAALMQRNDHDDALACYAEAMELIKRSKGEDHPEVCTIWTMMGDANIVRERYDLAKDCYAAALQAHRMRGLQDTDSPVLWMLQKIRVIEDIVASAYEEDKEFIDELATHRDSPEELDKRDGVDENVGKGKDLDETDSQCKLYSQGTSAIATSDEAFLNELATKAESEQDESSQLLAQQQQQDDEDFLNELARTTTKNTDGQSPKNADQASSFSKEEEDEAFLAELASGTMSDSAPDRDGRADGRPANAAVVPPPSMPKPVEKSDPSFTGSSPLQQQVIDELLLPEEDSAVDTPAGIKMIVPQALSADDTVSLITFKEEEILNAQKDSRRASSSRHKRQQVHRDSRGQSQKEDWLANALGNIVEATAQATDNFLRPLTTEPPKEKEPKPSKVKGGQAPISEVTFAEIARTMSAESDITDIMEEGAGFMPLTFNNDYGVAKGKDYATVRESSAVRGFAEAGTGADEDLGEDIGIEVDELLAQMNVSASGEDNDASPRKSPRHSIGRAIAKISVIDSRASTVKSNAEYAAFSPRSGKKKKSRKTAHTAEIKAMRKTLEQVRATSGPSSEATANTLTCLAELYKNEGDLDSALEICAEELNVRRRVLGPGHFSIAFALNRTGIIRLEKDEFDLAKQCHTEALQIQQACLGENEHNPDVSQTLVNLGDVYYKERNSLKKIKSNGNNAEYDNVIDSGMLCRIAFAHDERGEYVRAMHFYDEHVELLKSKGDNKYIPGIINALNCLGSLNKKTGRYVEALDYHTKALHMQKSIPGLDKFEIANTSVLIGMVEFKAGRFKKALALFTEALPVQQKKYGKKHAVPARTIFNMALVHDELADHIKSMSLLEQSLTIQKSVLPQDHPDILSTRMYIARLHSCAGNFDIAMPSLMGVLLSQKQLFGPKHPLVADTLHNIGICHARRGKMNSALKSYEECFTIRKEILGYEHPDIAGVLNSIAAVHASKKRNEKALPIYEAALKIRRDALGDSHVDVARTLSNQGVAYAALRKFPQAMKVYTEAKKIRETALGPFHPSVGDSHVNIGNVFLRKCAFTEARCEFEAALFIYSKSPLRSDDPKIARTKAIIDRVKRDEKLCV